MARTPARPGPERPAPGDRTRRPPRRVVVTGGAGFLGSHLCDRLLGEGHEVVCLDNFQSGAERNLEHLAGHPRFSMVRHDVTEPIPAGLEVDAIYEFNRIIWEPGFQLSPRAAA